MAAKVKLTTEEGLELVNIALGKLGADVVLPILASALPPEKVGRLVLRQSTPLTEAEKRALVDAAIPAIPGNTLKQKLAFVVKEIRPVFETRKRYDEVMAYVVERVIAYLKAQQGGGASAPAAGLDFRLGYGPVNNWRNVGDKAIVSATVAACVGIVPIEFFEWSAWKRFKDVDGQLAALDELLAATTASGQILYLTFVNSNTGSGKYSDPGIKLSAYSVPIWKAAARIAALMKTHPRLFVTPVGEGGVGPDPKFDKQVQDWFLANAPKAQLVNNWGARTAGGGGMGNYCVHPSSTKNIGSGTAWVMSDHGLLIRELNGGALYGTANVGITGSYARKVTDAGRKFIYYHFDQNAKIDANALAALKGVAKPQAAPGPALAGWPADLADVTWLHANVRDWKATAKMTASIGEGQIRFPYDKADAWPVATSGVEKGTNANVWAIVQIGGKWFAGTWEWLRKGQTSKPMWVLDRSTGKGDHFKKAPLSSWVPKSGESFYVMVSGHARSSGRNVMERSDPVKVTWP